MMTYFPPNHHYPSQRWLNKGEMTCSIQSHLSKASSQQRLRTAPALIAENMDRLADEEQFTTASTSLANKVSAQIGLVITPALPGTSYNRHSFARLWSTLLIKWIAAVYCLLSCIVLTTDCYKYLCISLADNGAVHQSSYLSDLSLSLRFSRISASKNALYLEPYLFGQPVIDQNEITACLWVKDFEDLKQLSTWTRSWPGPLSVLLSTTAIPLLLSHSDLLERLHNLSRQLEKSRLSLHILHVKAQNSSAPNLYLNLARLFAPTSRVVLFPASVEYIPHNTLYDLLSVQNSSYPIIVTTPLHATYPFSSLSPIFLRQNHNTWCTERYLANDIYVTDWQECVWQVWMESLGKAKIALLQDVPGEHLVASGKPAHIRMNSNFRSEYCDLAIRNFGFQNRDGKISLHWLKNFCAETVDKKYKI